MRESAPSRLRFENPCELRDYEATTAPTAAYASVIAEGYPRARSGKGKSRRRSPSDLSAIEHRQCVDALTAGQRLRLTLPKLLCDLDAAFEGMSDIREAVIGPTIEWWDLVDEKGRVRYRAWFYGVDCGIVYEPKSLERVASVCQGSLDTHGLLWSRESALLWLALAEAHELAAREHPASELATHEVPSEIACSTCDARVARGGHEMPKGCRKCAVGMKAIAECRVESGSD